MKLPHSPLLITVMCFTFGACLSFFVAASFYEWVWVGCAFLLVTLLFQILSVGKIVKTILLYSCFLLFGLLYFKAYYQPSKNHFQFLKSRGENLKQIEIQDHLGSSDFSNSYLGKITNWDKRNTTGKILIQQSKDSSTKPWLLGQKILTMEEVRFLKGPLNPGQFSYKSYLANKKINHRLNLDSKNSVALAEKKSSLKALSKRLRHNALLQIEKSPLTHSSQGMLKALLFAERNALDDTLIQNYAHAGVVHLLALSGLHLGLFVGFLLYLLKPLTRFKFGTSIRTITIVCFLWGFAFVVGFPASVTRAVSMFSFMIIGRNLHYGKHTFHYTVLSFFMLLLCYPPYLKSIGFQLSYLAVFGILLIHPLLQRLWRPKTLLLKRYWEWTTVCLAAQLAVSPLSIYYFNQFPSLFLISNLLIVPFFGIFLILCIVVFCVLLFTSIPKLLINLFEKVVTLLNQSIEWIAQKEAFLFDNLFISTKTLLLIYFILILWVLWNYKKSFWWIASLGLVMSGLLFNYSIELKKFREINSFWVFHKHNATLIGHQKNSHFHYFSSVPEATKSLVLDFTNSRHISAKIPIKIENFYLQGTFKLLILDNDEPYEFKHFEPQYILLRNNPKLNIERLLNYYKPQVLIADGSNATWNIALWEKSCQNRTTQFYYTGKNGALEISL